MRLLCPIICASLCIVDYLIDVERIAVTTVSLFESTSVSSTELDTPKSDGFITDTNASFGEQILDITMA